ncbi:response regulator transcription factor [Peribacillus frigoritolerans]|uniref:response regulator transcription factor n=1 Tax=Peribacillus frigoritolerans TaxID=450367 RepID=UPI0010713802|nr:response regulator transcription factor [Peribacillus frigoritolerans]TFH61929.1 response regulator transcription factor [Peribacillus frigoritolerans]
MYASRILIVDDEMTLVKMVKVLLKKEGFTNVDASYVGRDALYLIEQNEYDLILLDVMLPDMEGFDICSIIRRRSDVPIFFLTARGSDFDKVSGFAYGADDYITKPFNPLELVARIKAQLKRNKKNLSLIQVNDRFDNGVLFINYKEAVVKVNGKEVNLSAQLYQLLTFFAKSPNQIFSKQQLYDRVWGADSYGDENTVIVHMRKLREKIEQNPSNPKLLITVRGIGYKFVSKSVK